MESDILVKSIRTADVNEKALLVKAVVLLLAFLHIPLFLYVSGNQSFSEWELQSSARISILVAFGLYLNVSFLYRERFWSVPSLTFLILALFHLGLFVTPALSGNLPDFVRTVGSSGTWFTNSTVSTAARYVTLALVAYSLGLTVCAFFRAEPNYGPNSFHQDERWVPLRENLGKVGLALLAISVLGWYLISVVFAGPLFFLSSYGEYLETTRTSTLLNYTYIGISFGLVMCAFIPERRSFVWAVLLFVLFAVPGLFLGMRDNVIIPLVSAAAVWAKIHRVRNGAPFLLSLFAGLYVASFVRQIRETGLGGVDSVGMSVTPFQTVEEMGFSLRVLVTTISWHEFGGEPYYRGATYWAPLARPLERLFGLGGEDAALDYRLMNVEVAERVGQIGGSMIAEAHHNFGLAGVVSVMFLAGFGLGLLTLRAQTPFTIAFLGVFTVLFLMHVRNSFAPIPFWLLMGIGSVLLAKLLPTREKVKNCV